MRKPNKNKMAVVNSRFASVSESEMLKIQEDAVPENTKKINYRFSMFKDSVNSFANSRMLCTACTFSTHELRGQLNRFLMVSF